LSHFRCTDRVPLILFWVVGDIEHCWCFTLSQDSFNVYRACNLYPFITLWILGAR
jgi:hypothetical protein